MAKPEKNGSVTVSNGKQHKVANIIVSIVIGFAALIIIAIAVLCSVDVAPLDKVATPERYDFYDLGSSNPTFSNEKTQSRIKGALDTMEFSIMSAVLQGKWDYSYNFVRSESGNKIEMNADEIDAVSAASNAYMIEFVYKQVEIERGEIVTSTAQSLEVDGETVYFDRLKVVIGDSAGDVGEIRLYPYIYDRVHNNAADDGETRAAYRITAIKVRANTTTAYAQLTELATAIKQGSL